VAWGIIDTIVQKDSLQKEVSIMSLSGVVRYFVKFRDKTGKDQEYITTSKVDAISVAKRWKLLVAGPVWIEKRGHKWRAPVRSGEVVDQCLPF